MERKGAALWAAAGAALVTSTVIGATALLPNLDAKFGPFDDDETILWLGSDGRLDPSEMLTTFLTKHEVANFGTESRFTPAMYVAKIIESVFFGTDVRMYYLSALVMFIAACALMGFSAAWWFTAAARISRSWLAVLTSAAGAVIATSLLASLGAWTDFATRLGASERIAILGFGLLLVGLTALGFDRRPAWWTAVLIGVTLSVLGKENFVVVAAAPLIMAVYRVASLGRRRYELIAGIAGLLPAVLLMMALANTLQGGRDQYGADTGSPRLAGALESLLVTYRWYWLPGAALLILSFVVWAWVRGRRGQSATLLVGALVALAFLWRFYDAWLYGIHGYAYARYELVPQLFKALGLLAAVALAVGAVRRADHRSTTIASWIALTCVCIYGVVVMASVPAGLRHLREESEVNRDATQSYSAALDRVVALARGAGGSSVAIVAQEPLDAVELVRSLALEVDLRDPNLQIVLISDLTAEEAAAPMAQGLRDLSVNGNNAIGLDRLSDAAAGLPLVCAIISGATTDSELCSPDLTVSVPVRIR